MPFLSALSPLGLSLEDFSDKALHKYTRTASACLLGIAMMPQLMAENAEKVFEQCSPTVVQLASTASEGSGVIINKDGLILTNLHVAAVGLPMTVSLTDKTGKITRTLEGATLYRVHPTKDLAILKVKLAGAKLPSASIAEVGMGPSPAATCYSISSPAGIEGALTNTFTQGTVSTPNRKVDGEDYIQFSAPVNAGSSGGALLNKEGKLIGVITAKQQGTEGVAFAIPMAGTDWKEFVEPAQRKGNAERHQKAIEMGHRAKMAGSLRMFSNPGNGLPEELNAAAYFANLALSETPTSSAGFDLLIEVYYLAGKQETCLALAKRAFEATGASEFLTDEAGSLSLLGKNVEARQVYTKALLMEDGKPSPRAAASMATILSKENPVNWPQVAYLAKWAVYSQEQQNSTNKEIVNLLEQALAKLPPPAVRALSAKKHPFTLEEMKQFPNKLPKVPEGDAKLLEAFDSTYYEPILASSSALLKLPDNLNPPVDKGEDRFLSIDGQIDEAIPASGGRIALLISRETNTVYLYDVARGFVMSKTECPAGKLKDNWVVGGLHHWALIDKKQLRYERFKLVGGGATPVVSEPTNKKVPWDAVGAVMSPYRDDIMWVILRDEKGKLSVAIDNFASGVIRVPDASAVPADLVRNWINHSHPRFLVDPAAMTCSPADGGPIFLAIDPQTFRLRPLPANFVPFGMYFPYSKEPASWIVGQRNTFTLKDKFVAREWTDKMGEGWVPNVVQTIPFYSAPWLVQLHSSRGLMIRIMDAETGRTLLPIRPVMIPEGTAKVKRQVIGRPRYEVFAHRSTDRIFIFDFQDNMAISAKIPYFDRIEERPLEITRRKGEVLRVPIPAQDGHTFSFDRFYPGTGLTMDTATKELVITDPDQGKLKPIMPYNVDVMGPSNECTHYPFRVHDPAADVPEKENQKNTNN